MNGRVTRVNVSGGLVSGVKCVNFARVWDRFLERLGEMGFYDYLYSFSGNEFSCHRFMYREKDKKIGDSSSRTLNFHKNIDFSV